VNYSFRRCPWNPARKTCEKKPLSKGKGAFFVVDENTGFD